MVLVVVPDPVPQWAERGVAVGCGCTQSLHAPLRGKLPCYRDAGGGPGHITREPRRICLALGPVPVAYVELTSS